MSRHTPTPGPWEIHHEGNTWAWLTGPGQAHPFVKVCTAPYKSRKDDHELLANLRLIRRAPQLYDLAKQLVAAGNTEAWQLKLLAAALIEEIEVEG